MEMQRFDALVRHVGEGSTRRRLLGLVSSTTLGGLLVTGLVDDTESKKKKKKKSCKNKTCGACQTCSKGKCLTAADGTACTGGTCTGGTCRPAVPVCPPAQVCELSETCCQEGITTSPSGVTYCGEFQDEICSCPAGDAFCAGTESSQCCLSGDACEQAEGGIGFCASETCSAANSLCTYEWASCGETCACVTSTGGANLCADFAEFFQCPETSECSTDAQCAGDDVCVDVDCRCGTGNSLGACLPPCAANGQRATSRKAAPQSVRDRVGPLR